MNTSTKLLIRGGTVVTMDAQNRVFPKADVLVEGNEIVDVAPDLGEIDAEVVDATDCVVVPGGIDTHRHTWQALLRGLCVDWTLADYRHIMRRSLSPVFTANDVMLGNRIGALEAIDAGVTTLLDYSHCMNTPDHADAALEALVASGGRAVFGYGFFDSGSTLHSRFPDHPARVQDFHRLADRLEAGSGRITIGAALSEVGSRPQSEIRAEIMAAREREALIVCHTGCVWAAPSGITELHAGGLLGPDMVHVHGTTLNEAEWRLISASEGKVSISVETELHMGMGRPAFKAVRRHGLAPTLSCDIVSLNSGDLFTQLRIALAFARWELAEPQNLRRIDPYDVGISASSALAWITTNAAEAIGRSHDLGALAAGYKADVVVVAPDPIRHRPVHDPFGTLVFHTTPADVRDVIVDGEVRKRNGRLLDVNISELSRVAESAGNSVIERSVERDGPIVSRLGQGFESVGRERERMLTNRH